MKQLPEWEAYKRHNVLRNAIVHEGQDAEPDEAKSSLEAVRGVCIQLADAAREKGASTRFERLDVTRMRPRRPGTARNRPDVPGTPICP